MSKHNRSKLEQIPAQQLVVQKQVMSYQGPIPLASEMARYEQCCPGSANRILTMTEQQGEHRRSLEKLAVSEGIMLNKRGQLFAFIIAGSILIFSFILILIGKDTAGFITLGGTVLGGISTYIYGKRKQDPKK